ncbi:MMPL family transporter [Marimonas sp. MJW-29]|uniref:MMPL family transporter n=1 Tax=Sulfitobacter sediminis TaxID=3234186 RepID=A0ABV3RMM3_9RHOB
MTFSDRLATFLFERNRLLMICLVAVMVFLASGIPRIQFSGDNRAFFGTGNQEFVDLKEIEQTYTTPTLLLLMLKPPEGTAFEAETLSALVAMAEDAWRMPYVLRVDLATNQMHSYAEGDEVLVEPMLDEFAEITPEAAARFRDLALASDDLRNRLLSEDGSAFGMSIRVVLPEGEPEAREAVEDYLANMRAGWQASYPDWEIRATGGLLGNNLLQRVAREDIRELVPYAFVAVVTVFILATGSLVSVFASVLAILCTTLGTFGFAGWSGMELTAGTAIAPLAVMVLVSTSCVHITLAAIRLH